MKAKIKVANPFRVESANKLYEEEGVKNSDCQEWGIDSSGKIYFSLLNGVVKRYSRREYIKRAREVYQ